MQISRILRTTVQTPTKKKDLTARSLERLQAINPQDAKLLLNTSVSRFIKGKEVQINLFQHIRDYKNHYKEKLVCFDPEVAKAISQTILESSEGNEDTPFIDADGCLCLISRQFSKLSKRPVTVFQRDEKFLPLFPKGRGAINQVPLNVHEAIFDENKYVDYGTQTMLFRNGWNNTVPSYTLFATCAHGFFKALSVKCIEAWSRKHNLVNHMFEDQRPEFYMLVHKRTLAHLTYDLSAPGMGPIRRVSYNHLIRATLDVQPLKAFPLEAFLPWHGQSARKHSSDSNRGKIYSEQADSLFLIRVRPKLELDFQEEFNHFHFMFLAHTIAKEGRPKLISTLESFLPDVGYDLIINGGYKMKTTMKDVHPDQLVNLFNILQSQKNYENSGFATAAELWGKNLEEEYE